MTIKGEQRSFKLNNYEIVLNPISDKTLAIQVIDTVLKIEFYQKELALQKIGVSTLVLALQAKRKQINVGSVYKKQGEFQVLELKVSVSSPFLKNIEQTIYIKKLRNVKQMEVLDKQMKNLSSKLKQIKQKHADLDGNIQYGYFDSEERTFNGASYQNIASINLKRGKYLLTFSFLLRATNQWMYIHLNQGIVIMQNSGFYVPSTTNFMAFTVRTIYTVKQDEQQVQFTTNSASSYPIILKNRIMTALKIPN